ncbi:MAG: DUF262 domain-containing protein [Streptococcaceae bacterium]|nr:DUF262 domain-containing protein [Streptococcaceae bacterium]
MSDYQVTTVTVSGLKDNLVLPKFQRGYVWNQTKKNELIDSLHRGFPFGSLLTYQKSADQKEQLLDGQQRWSTILDFQNNKASYYKKLEPVAYKYGLDELNQWISNNEKISEFDFDNVVSGKVNLADWVDDKFEKLNFGEMKSKDVRDLILKIQSKIDEYLKVEDLQIPIIRYTGDEGNKAQVFENLNKGGVQLTKFEIFAAAWTHTQIQLDNSAFQSEILNYVKQFYLQKQDKAEEFGFSLDGFSEDELSASKLINLFELGVGLGTLIQKRVPALVTETEKNINEIGFGVLGISVDIDPKRLGEIPNKLIEISNNLEVILKKADRISRQLSAIFDKLIRQNTNRQNDGLSFQRSLTTTYKTLSYFASLWDIETGSEVEKKILSNIPAYYVRDSIDGLWTSTGDTRLYEYYASRKENRRSYLETPLKDEFIEKFRIWIRDENTQTERFSADIKALATIHANLTYLADFVDFGEPLQFEHIYPKARIRAIDTGNKVLLGRLGNAMYLPKSVNQNKKTKTLYEIDNSEKYQEVIKESAYPSEEDFKTAFEALEKNNFGIINDKILQRSNEVAAEIVGKLVESKF